MKSIQIYLTQEFPDGTKDVVRMVPDEAILPENFVPNGLEIHAQDEWWLSGAFTRGGIATFHLHRSRSDREHHVPEGDDDNGEQPSTGG